METSKSDEIIRELYSNVSKSEDAEFSNNFSKCEPQCVKDLEKVVETEVPKMEETECSQEDLTTKSEETEREIRTNISKLEERSEEDLTQLSIETQEETERSQEDLTTKSEETEREICTNISKLEERSEEDLTQLSIETQEETERDIQTLEQQCVEEFRKWIETEAPFYGRTDEDFLLIFLRGCKFDMNKSKKKLTKYYENRKKIPEWWADRDISDLKEVIGLHVSTLLIDKDPHLPCVIINKPANVGQDSSLFEKHMKGNSVALDLVLRRQNCQLNGLIWIIDFKDQPTWLMTKFFNPKRLYNVLQGYTTATPLRIKGIHVINTPLIGRALWQMAKPMCPAKFSKRIRFYGADWSSLKDYVDERLLPEEYGGINGKMSDHEDAFVEEFDAFSDYILDDNKYGFK